jgi:RND family efflux transporter MFP subunit
MRRCPAFAALALASCLAGCGEKAEAPAAGPRPVRVLTVGEAVTQATTSFTGRVEAKDSAALAFRIGGRMIERSVGKGDRVKDGEIVARLEPQDEENALRSARAALAAAQGQLVQAENAFDRQRRLLDRGATTQAYFEAAEQGRIAGRARVEAAEAQLRNAEETLSFTVLKADAPGIVTNVGAEPGEVVRAGQPIVQLARRDGRDAVFDVPAALKRAVSVDRRITIRLADSPTVTAAGRVREVSPQADPVTRTFTVRVGLIDPPAAFRLGSSVTGSIDTATAGTVSLPAAALAGTDTGSSVWVVDAKTSKVVARPVQIARAEADTVWIAKGLAPGDVVVTAGAASLTEGQAVRLPGAEL